MRVVCEFSTVEEFWKVWHNVPRPSELFFDGESRKEINGVQIEALSVFKKGIVPEWEDACNRYGSQVFSLKEAIFFFADCFVIPIDCCQTAIFCHSCRCILEYYCIESYWRNY